MSCPKMRDRDAEVLDQTSEDLLLERYGGVVGSWI